MNLIHTRCISGYHGSHRLLHGLVVHAESDVMETISRISSPVSLLVNLFSKAYPVTFWSPELSHYEKYSLSSAPG